METASLVLKVDSTDARRATRELDDLAAGAGRSERASERLMRQAKMTGAVIGGLATGAFALAIRNTVEQERVTAQLEARLRSTGGAAGLAKKELLDMASGLQAVTTYGDESIITAQSLLLTFTKIGRDVFPSALETVLDMSTAMGQDLKSSAIQLGKALNDPIQGVSALTRVGVQFSDAQKDTIERLVETGKTAEAQKIILAELESQMGGSARAARDTLGGALEGLKNAFGDLLEGDTGSDGVRGAKQAIEDMITLLNSAEVKEGFGTIVSGLFNVASGAAKAASEIANLTRRVAEGVAARVNGAALDDIPNMELEAERLRGRLGRIDARGWRIRGGGQEPGEQMMRDRLAVLERSILEARSRARVSDRMSALQQQSEKLLGPIAQPNSPSPGTGGSGGGDRVTPKTVREAMTERGPSASQILDLREFTEGQVNAERATLGWSRRIEDLRAELEGPLAQATLIYARSQAEVNAALIAGHISAEQAAEANRLLAKQHEATKEAIESGSAEMSQFATQAARNMQSTFADLLYDPVGDGASKMADRFADALRRMAADLAASKLLEAVGGWASGYTGSGSGWVNALGGALKGGRAFGGPVMAGESYRVGERGRPEIFTPSTSGRITPIPDGGSRAPVVKLEVINNGSPAQASVQQSRQPDGSQLIRLVLNAVGDSIASGSGAPYSAMKGRFNLRDAV